MSQQTPEQQNHQQQPAPGATGQPASNDQQPPAPGQQSGSQQPATRPDGISEQEWAALGDPGRTAIVREREARQAAERALAASRARPAPPASAQPEAPQPAQPAGQAPAPASTTSTNPSDIASIVQQAVAAAIKPFTDAEAQRSVDAAVSTLQDAVLSAAETSFVDPTDALSQVDLTHVTDGYGRPDAAKITQALNEVLTRKPHLARPVDSRRFAPAGAGAGQPAAPLEQQVQSTLQRMQGHAGIRPAVPTAPR